MSLCKYKHIFGEEGKGVHSIRLFNIAIVDLVLTVLAAWLISRYIHVHFVWCLVALLGLGIVAHRLFCLNTTVNVALFGKV